MTTKKTSAYAVLLLGTAVLAIVMWGVTVFCGSLSGRWGMYEGQQAAKKLLRELPMAIGDWKADEEKEISATDVDMLRIKDGYVVRSYRNVKSHDIVNLIFMVGPTGRIVVHTPEICFGGKNYEKNDVRDAESFPIVNYSGTGPTDDSFWKVKFTNRSIQGGDITFYYGLSTGDAWEALDNPRFALQRYRYVYKLQAEAYLTEESDPVKDFLTDCLPTIRNYLMPCQ